MDEKVSYFPSFAILKCEWTNPSSLNPYDRPVASSIDHRTGKLTKGVLKIFYEITNPSARDQGPPGSRAVDVSKRSFPKFPGGSHDVQPTAPPSYWFHTPDPNGTRGLSVSRWCKRALCTYLKLHGRKTRLAALLLQYEWNDVADSRSRGRP